jgi:hypothetical protein
MVPASADNKTRSDDNNQYQRRGLPEPRLSEQAGRTDAVHDLACPERRLFDAVAAQMVNRRFWATINRSL